MALFSLPPTSSLTPLGDTLSFGERQSEESLFLKKRTLAPEWYPQSGIQLTWPHAGTDWAYMLGEVTDSYVRLAFEIARREPLLIVANNKADVQHLIDERLPHKVAENICIAECPTNDTWARDHAFLTVVSSEGAELLDFRFNGWGGKFEAAKDNAINQHLIQADNAPLLGKYVDCLDFELEGGSIETDGNGTLLTTSQCLLNPNRNAHLQQSQIEDLLRERLGVSHILWLEHGALAGDDTDSHIDTLARLCPDNTILYVRCTNSADEHYAELLAMEEQLATFRTPDGKPYKLLPLPMADAITDENGERLPATYANYLVMDSVVLYPTYAQPGNDEAAARIIRAAFPDHDVVGIDCRALIRQHGSLHCATMQYPRGVLNFPH